VDISVPPCFDALTMPQANPVFPTSSTQRTVTDI